MTNLKDWILEQGDDGKAIAAVIRDVYHLVNFVLDERVEFHPLDDDIRDAHDLDSFQAYVARNIGGAKRIRKFIKEEW